MFSTKFLIVLQLLLLIVVPNSDLIKIGISKPLQITTTTAASTTAEILTDETNAKDESTTTVSTIFTTETTGANITNGLDPEWSEFPPRVPLKPSNKTATEKPPTTTAKPATTTITANETSTHEPEMPTAAFPKWAHKQKYCFCDLIKDTCDINCCCDQDCSVEAFKVFRCQLETGIDLELHEGRFEDFKFQHGLPSCEVNDGWLCVFKTYKPVAKEEAAYYLKDTSSYYKWPNMLLESEDVKNREFYKFGDMIRIINMKTKEIQNFDLPSSFESSNCLIQEPIFYLKPIKRSCLMSHANLKEAEVKLLQLEEDYKVFNTPIIPDDIYYNKLFANFVGNITSSSYLRGKQNAIEYKRGKENADIYILFKVQVNVLHNFTNIQNIIIDLWFEDFKSGKYLESLKQDYWLSYETEFFNKTLKEFNATKGKACHKPKIISGPLGYLSGKPLIVARYEPLNKSQPLSTKNQVLNYFSANNNETHALTLFAKENGECKHSKSPKEFISYGVNVAKYCKIRLANDSVIEDEPSNTNFTKICTGLQQLINDQLFGPDLLIEDFSSYFISQLGKPQNIPSKWLQLEVYNSDFDSVVGQYLHETKTFVCRNILLSLAYEFHMATFVVDDVPLQSIINHAALHLAERHDLEFSLNENLEVPITMTVRFYDALERTAAAASNLNNYSVIFYLISVLILNN